MNTINLIVGDNNCGKTSVLEAIQLLKSSTSYANCISISRQRELLALTRNSAYENFINMFSKLKKDLKISVSGKYDDKDISYSLKGDIKKILLDNDSLFVEEKIQDYETESFQGIAKYQFGTLVKEEKIELNNYTKISGIMINEKNEIKIVYILPYEHLTGNIFTQIIKNDAYKKICISALQLFDPHIDDLLILKSDVGNRPIEYIKHKTLGNMPLSTYGDGIKKVLVLANAIISANKGILLIDEIETSIHKKYYDDIFQFIVKACKAFEVQLFATTHNLEAIDGILATQNYPNNVKDDCISIITLKKETNRTYSRVMTGKEVFDNREAFGFEVRA